MSSLHLDGLVKRYGAVTAVDSLTLDVPQGGFLSLVGPSGCGKTTALRMVAGLIAPDGGRIRVGGDDITRVPVHRRNLGLVFQSYALFPHMSVADNVGFGLRQRGVAASQIAERVGRALARVRLDPLAERLPRELSGGQQQRTALARALVVEPRILLLDEPFSNLDALLREELRIEIKRLQQELGITTLFVTHDQAEALAMADQVAVMNHGRLEQVASPAALYRQPATPFVAHFIGRANLLAGEVRAARGDSGVLVALAGGGRVEAAAPAALAPGTPVRVVVRQEAIRIVAAPASQQIAGEVAADAPIACGNRFPGAVALASFAGALSHYLVRLDHGSELQVQAPSSGAQWGVGARVIVEWEPHECVALRGDPTA
jgi:ABC-type Fe3+/spermidine/putrescine transport system ATPase subunit